MGRLGLLKVSGTYHFYENNAPALRRLNDTVDKINGALQAAAYLLNALHTINLLNGPKPFMVYFNESIMSKHGNANKHARSVPREHREPFMKSSVLIDLSSRFSFVIHRACLVFKC